MDVGKILEASKRAMPPPPLGLELARLNPGLLPDNLGARNPLTVWPAHRFLVHIRGQDLGWAPDPWKAWIAV